MLAFPSFLVVQLLRHHLPAIVIASESYSLLVLPFLALFTFDAPYSFPSPSIPPFVIPAKAPTAQALAPVRLLQLKLEPCTAQYTT